MTALPLLMRGRCVLGDDELFAHMASAIERGLPEITGMSPAHNGIVALVGSGPSASGQLEALRKLRREGVVICGIKDAHDWLSDNGMAPDYALALDPQERRATCFKRKNSYTTRYLIASQCHPSAFDDLKDCNVILWHLLFKEGQTFPEGRFLIPGATTSGLRALSVFYVLGYREFHLFGFDSCLSGDVLRVDGSGLRDGENTMEIQIDPSPDAEKFICNGSMALQAQAFQDYYRMMPDATFIGYGHGLIQAIIEKRKRDGDELMAMEPEPDNGRVSFIHKCDENSASYRYRSRIPAETMGVALNDLTASTLIFSKPEAKELMEMGRAKRKGQRVIVDFCDDHFEWPLYQEAFRLADEITCPTEEMAKRIRARGREATVIPDPYEYPLEPPHVQGVNLLWYGHHTNRFTLQRILPAIEGYPLLVVSNFHGAIPWSAETLRQAFAGADIVLLPATESYKSANRAVEAIRQGCFVVAEPHPAWNDIPGIWIGDIKDGIEWVGRHCTEANQRLLEAQSYVTEKFSPSIVMSAWKTVISRLTTSDAEKNAGLVGST